LLNPLLTDCGEVMAKRTDEFEDALRAAGRQVKRYRNIGAQISRSAIYPLLTRVQLASTTPRATNEHTAGAA